MQRVPFDFPGEYRGLARHAGDWVDRSTGQVHQAAARLTFEFEQPDGTVASIDFPGSAFDKAKVPFDYAKLAKGDVVRLYGVTIVQDRSSDRDSYVQLLGCEMLAGKAGLKAAA